MTLKFIDIVKRHLGPPVNIEAIIRAMGVELDKKAALHSDIAGQLEKLSEGRFRISVNKDDTYYRQRFTMAHELGHYMMHAHLIGDGVDDNTAYRSVPDGNFFNESITPKEETQANQFAARLLLPKSIIHRYAKEGTSVKELSVKLQASQPATEIRLRNLGYTVNDGTITETPVEVAA